MLFVRGCRGKFAHDQRGPDVLQRGVDRVNQQLHDHRLMRTGQHQTRPGFRDQIVRAFRQPSIVELTSLPPAASKWR